MARRRTKVTATLFDADGWPFIEFQGTPQDVGDAVSVYILNLANPLGGTPIIELIETREDEQASQEGSWE
jgi:hypothetical protein